MVFVVNSSVCTVTIGWTFVSLRLSFNDLMIVSDGSNQRLYDRWGVLDSNLCYCFSIFSLQFYHHYHALFISMKYTVVFWSRICWTVEDFYSKERIEDILGTILIFFSFFYCYYSSLNFLCKIQLKPNGTSALSCCNCELSGPA